MGKTKKRANSGRGKERYRYRYRPRCRYRYRRRRRWEDRRDIPIVVVLFMFRNSGRAPVGEPQFSETKAVALMRPWRGGACRHSSMRNSMGAVPWPHRPGSAQGSPLEDQPQAPIVKPEGSDGKTRGGARIALGRRRSLADGPPNIEYILNRLLPEREGHTSPGQSESSSAALGTQGPQRSSSPEGARRLCVCFAPTGLGDWGGVVPGAALEDSLAPG